MMRVFDLYGNDRLTQDDVARLQSMECQNHNGKTPKKSLAAIAQSSLKHAINSPAETDPMFVRQFSSDLNKVVDKDDAAKVCSIYSKLNKGRTPKKSLAARAQSAADRNENRQKLVDGAIQTSLVVTGEVPVSEDWARLLQSDTARRFNGHVAKGSTAALAQSAAAKAKNLQLLQSAEGVEQMAESMINPTKMTVAKLQSAYAHSSRTANIPSRVPISKAQSVADKREAKNKMPMYSEPAHTDSAITEGFHELP